MDSDPKARTKPSRSAVLEPGQHARVKKGTRRLKCGFQEHDSVIALISFIWSTNTDGEGIFLSFAFLWSLIRLLRSNEI